MSSCICLYCDFTFYVFSYYPMSPQCHKHIYISNMSQTFPHDSRAYKVVCEQLTIFRGSLSTGPCKDLQRDGYSGLVSNCPPKRANRKFPIK